MTQQGEVEALMASLVDYALTHEGDKRLLLVANAVAEVARQLAIANDRAAADPPERRRDIPLPGARNLSREEAIDRIGQLVRQMADAELLACLLTLEALP